MPFFSIKNSDKKSFTAKGRLIKGGDQKTFLDYLIKELPTLGTVGGTNNPVENSKNEKTQILFSAPVAPISVTSATATATTTATTTVDTTTTSSVNITTIGTLNMTDKLNNNEELKSWLKMTREGSARTATPELKLNDALMSLNYLINEESFQVYNQVIII